MTNSEQEKSDAQKRIEAQIKEQRLVAERNREKAREEQRRFGWGDKG